MRRAVWAGGIAFAVTAFAALVVIGQVNRFMSTPLAVPADGLEFEIPSGSSFSAVSEKLVEDRVIPSDHWLRLYVRWHKKAGVIQAGEYLLEQGATPESMLLQFTEGAVRLHTFTLVEGWNHREVLAAMHANEALRPTLTDEDWPALLESLGAIETHPEGLFLPETYRFPRNTTDRELLSQAYKLMTEVLAEEWAARSADTPVATPYEALILA